MIGDPESDYIEFCFDWQRKNIPVDYRPDYQGWLEQQYRTLWRKVNIPSTNDGNFNSTTERGEQDG